MNKKQAFDMFGLKQTNHVWSWSAISKDGKTVATTVWADQVGRTNDPSLFVDTFNLPHNQRNELWKDANGNRERIEHLAHAMRELDGLVRVLLVHSKDPDAYPREVKPNSVEPLVGRYFKVVKLDENTGEFQLAEIGAYSDDETGSAEQNSTNIRSSIETLNEIQTRLRVSMIMTTRDRMAVCRQDELIAEVLERNNGQFTYLPVVDRDEKVIGIFDCFSDEAKSSGDATIKSQLQALNEDLLIGGDASIYEFLSSADERPVRLVVSGTNVTGLVTFSDLQQLPVRVSIFSLLTNLELMLAELILQEFPSDEDWIALLASSARDAILARADATKAQDTFVSNLTLSQLSDKMNIVRKSGLINIENKRLKNMFFGIRNLRNSIAHAKDFAQSPDEVKEVCKVVRDVLYIKQSISL